MAGISPKLPLQLNPEDGIALNKTLKETIKQNLKMLVLTAPGERLMIPDYGVGIRNFLFEQSSAKTIAAMNSRIKNQIATYMPSLNLLDVDFSAPSENSHVLNVTLTYSVPSIIDTDVLTITLNSDSAY
tara:strand:+ start:2577 stop:2963 length:387 start_codon:yes stop_codon:yes gene_type:complete